MAKQWLVDITLTTSVEVSGPKTERAARDMAETQLVARNLNKVLFALSSKVTQLWPGNMVDPAGPVLGDAEGERG